MGTFSDFETAQKMEKSIRKIVTDEISKQRPADRYAIVESIDHADRSVMARFVGETDAVRIPFLDAIPSIQGQEVKVSGKGSDRAITGIRGTSDDQSRLDAIEAELARRAPCFGEWIRTGVSTAFTSGTTIMAWTGTTFDPIGFAAVTAGNTEIIIPTDGYYELTLSATNNAIYRKDYYVQVIPASGASNYDCMHVSSDFDASSAACNYFTLSGIKKVYLKKDDHLRVNHVSGIPTTMFGNLRTAFGIRRLYAGPYIAAA